ncbi:MAG: hypothetical protein P1V81_03105 [Planctomycetota bacterium]|nr:hypothetical protein [Planctomycetota bacterium]
MAFRLTPKERGSEPVEPLRMTAPGLRPRGGGALWPERLVLEVSGWGA